MCIIHKIDEKHISIILLQICIYFQKELYTHNNKSFMGEINDDMSQWFEFAFVFHERENYLSF